MIAFVGLVGLVTEYTSGLMNVNQPHNQTDMAHLWVANGYASVYSMYCI